MKNSLSYQWMAFLHIYVLGIYRSLDSALEKAMAAHSSTLAWKIPWMEKPGGLQSMGSLRVGHDWATSLSLFTFMHWRRKWQPLQCSCLENPRDRGAWWAAVYGVAQSRTRLKWRSSSSKLISSNRIVVNDAVNNQLTIKIARRNINNLRYAHDITLWKKAKRS